MGMLASLCAAAAEERIGGGSIVNEGQAILAVRVIQRLLRCGVRAGDVGVVAPYTAQVNLLTTKLQRAGMKVARGVNDMEANGGSGLVRWCALHMKCMPDVTRALVCVIPCAC